MATAKSLDWTRIRGHHHKDRIPDDFSLAGYGILPECVAATQTLLPINDGRDRTGDIQRALDQGGVIELSGGIWPCDASLAFTRSNTVLRGVQNATIEVRGPRRTFITIGTNKPERPRQFGRTKIVKDDYIPVGAPSFRVEKPEAVKAGSRILIERRITREWIAEMGMADLVRNGQPQTWLRAGAILRQMNGVKSVKDDWVTLETTLVDSIRLEWSPELVSYEPPAQVKEVGIANLTIRAVPSHSGDSIAVQPGSLALQVNPYIERLWIRNIAFEGFLSSITLEAFTTQVTIQDCAFRRTAPTDRSHGWPSDVQLKGTRALILRCRTEALVAGASAFAVVTQSLVPGPNAVVQYTANQGWLSPHQRYAMGILFDNCDVDKIELHNRGTAGSGHGWAVANAAAWNCRVKSRLTVQKPPTAQNWAIGCSGSKVGNGAFIEHGGPVEPWSLFADQLERRFGSDYAAQILGPSYRRPTNASRSRDEL